ncbi:uncharacterized protein EI97DRAFT_420100 [Westerdykella ornata]|uniref:Aminoglycoside phosphotransferase domain-containing protein n=1 Tax=Westerdykella ornata TaxID=318751 RepID=A0A6A6JHW9_WESOR|nr:uncharacterized protein EI97DRAFT_420100 [Westerdykella ornata]KAF2275683.1 hypothetical protein EI97DRAFT_420100 [Westerdykella ornata]
MPMWACDSDGCSKPAVRNAGDCILCNRHLCSLHLQSPYHQCPSWEDADHYDPAAGEAERKEIERLLQKINKEALAARASELRDGMPCTIPALQYDGSKRSSIMGGMNYHIDIVFEDGVVWLARIRRFDAASPPPALRDHIFQSEVATMKFLEEVAIPTPRVFDFALESEENPVGVGYMLIEKMPGTSLRWSLASPDQRRKVVEQLADMLIELRKHPFDKMGSLELSASGPLHIGAFARESLTDFDRSRISALGPYSSLEEYHTASIRLILDLILREEMYSQNPIDAYLIHRFLLDLIPSVLPPPSFRQNTKDHHFFLKHADDKGDHILVDDDYNITALIDWEWAYTAPEPLAFNSPVGLLPVAEFYNGVNALGEEEEWLAQMFELRGHLGLARAVRGGRVQHFFAFCCGYDLSDWKGFLGLFRGLRDAVGVDPGLGWEEWKGVALERYRGDEGLRVLLGRV